MRALVSSDCITGLRTHDSVDRPVVIACTRQTPLDFPNRGTAPDCNTTVTRLIVRIVSIPVSAVSVAICPVAVSPIAISVRIVAVEKRIVKERITKAAEEDEPIIEPVMMMKIAITPKIPKPSGTETRSGPSEPRPHPAGCHTAVKAATTTVEAASSGASSARSASGETMPLGHGNRGGQSDCRDAACEQN